MSGNVHGHQLPPKGINVNPDNPIFGRHQPDPVVAEIPQGLHGAPALRSELELPAPVDSRTPLERAVAHMRQKREKELAKGK